MLPLLLFFLVERSENECLFLTGSAGTGKTLLLTESLKIKLSKLQAKKIDVKILVSTFYDFNSELLAIYKQHYLKNISNVEFTNMNKLCSDLKTNFDGDDPQNTIKNLLTSLSVKYSESFVILLCDEVRNNWKIGDWNDMVTCHNVIWLLAVNPRSYEGPYKIKVPTSKDVISEQLLINYRNCYQIR